MKYGLKKCKCADKVPFKILYGMKCVLIALLRIITASIFGTYLDVDGLLWCLNHYSGYCFKDKSKP